MEFEVTFVCLHGKPLSIDSEQIGLNKLIEIRDKTGQKIPSEKVENRIPGLYQNQVSVNVSEKIACKSGYFQNQTSVSIWVSECFLNQFAYQEARIIKNSETGEIQLLRISWILGTALIIEAWSNAGYPKNWR